MLAAAVVHIKAKSQAVRWIEYSERIQHPRWAVEMTHPINNDIDGHCEGDTGPDADDDDETTMQVLSAHFLFIKLDIMMGYFHEAECSKGI